MPGPKLNEKNREAHGTKGGTRAEARYVRSSASKARVVLNLIRDVDVKQADEILEFTDREMARVVRKVLKSAVANAVENDAKDADDLYVKACFADEGPTLKRFRPRAKGRAGKINKRTCHITVIVDTMSDERLAVREAKTMSRGGAAGGRSARVAASRASRTRAPKKDEAAAEAPASENETVAEATGDTEEAGN
ncbi:MAG: ribosomal protein [Actinomycetota bacterium]|jgi:large subunit ribosomal protein L22